MWLIKKTFLKNKQLNSPTTEINHQLNYVVKNKKEHSEYSELLRSWIRFKLLLLLIF